MANDHKELKYEIITNVGIVSEHSGGWKKELNRISWNGGEPKYDLRTGHLNMQKWVKALQ